jgi:hypothetical protein
VNFNNDFRYDLEIGKEGERIVDSLFKDKLVEVKRDSWVSKSGNIAIEYESRGKPSGIATTEADYWIIIFSGGYQDKVMCVFETELLKEVSRRYFKIGSIKAMGDNNTSMSVIIPIKEICNFVLHD